MAGGYLIWSNCLTKKVVDSVKRKSIHPLIGPFNYPLFDRYAADHPALIALWVHAEARDFCVGREIPWKDLGNHPIDQSWYSTTMQRECTFSGFAYGYLSFDLVLEGWLKLPHEPTASELTFLRKTCPEMTDLLTECLEAAQEDANTEVLPLIEKAKEFVDALQNAILYRFSEQHIPWETQSIGSAPYQNGYQLEHKGYLAEWEHDEEMRYFGRVTNVEADIQFETYDFSQLEPEFRRSVDEYLDKCQANQQPPELPPAE